MNKFIRILSVFMMISLFLAVMPLYVFATEQNAIAINSDAPDRNDPHRLLEIEEVNKRIDEYFANKISPASSSSNGLSVPLYKQDNSYYCGPASVQMAVKYITGITYQQSVLANSMGTSSSGGTYVYRIANEMNARCGSGTYQYAHTSEASFSGSLIYSIDKGKPVICHVKTGALPNYNYQSDTGHYIVAKGYYVAYSGSSSSSTCQYNDPHYNSNYYGTYTCSMSTMLSAINANSGYFIRGT